MSNYCGIWPIHPRLLPEELLSSWLFRIAKAHKIKLHTFTHRAFPGIAIWNRDVDKAPSHELLKLLASKTGRPLSEVYQSTLASYEGYLYESNVKLGHPHWITTIGVYHRNRKNCGLSFCPICLREDSEPYFRRIWRIGFSVVCLKHKTLLLDCCPRCKSPISFHRNDFTNKYEASGRSISQCYYCDFALMSSQATFENDPILLAFLEKLYTTLSQGYIIIGNHVVYSHLYFDVIYQLLKLLAVNSITQKLRQYLEKKADAFPLSPIRQMNHFTFNLPINERLHILRLLAQLLLDWPNSFVKACEDVRISKCRLEKDMNYIPFWFQEILNNHLNQKPYIVSNLEIQAAEHCLIKMGKKISLTLLKSLMGYADSKVINKYLQNRVNTENKSISFH